MVVEYPTEEQLRQLYLFFDRKYFNSTLPPLHLVHLALKPKHALSNRVDFDKDRDPSTETVGLTMSPALNAQEYIVWIAGDLNHSFAPAWVLLHEMIHVGVDHHFRRIGQTLWHNKEHNSHCDCFIYQAQNIYNRFNIKTMIVSGLYPDDPGSFAERIDYMARNYSKLVA